MNRDPQHAGLALNAARDAIPRGRCRRPGRRRRRLPNQAQAGMPRQVGRQSLADAAREIGLLRIARQGLERRDRDGDPRRRPVVAGGFDGVRRGEEKSARRAQCKYQGGNRRGPRRAGPAWDRDRRAAFARPDRRDQAIAALRDGLDVGRRARVVAERLAQLDDALGQRFIADDDTGPHPGKELLAGDDAADAIGERMSTSIAFGSRRTISPPRRISLVSGPPTIRRSEERASKRLIFLAKTFLRKSVAVSSGVCAAHE